MTVTHLTKVVNGSPFGERPTVEELDALNRTVWANLPPYVDGMTVEDWARYDAAFRAAKDRPAWELMPTILNPGYNGDGGAMMRAQAEGEHQVLLGKALVEGRITAITHAGAPVLNPFLGNGVYVSVRELERYLADLALPIELRIGESESQQPPANPMPAPERHAEIILAEMRAAGYDPMALPPREGGKPWVRHEMRERSKGRLTDSQFNKAWQLLNDRKRIAERS